MVAPSFRQNRARSSPIQHLGDIYESNDLLFTLKIHHSGNFTSPPGRIYHCVEIEWIPRKSLDEGLVPLMSNQDVLSLLQYVPIYKEIEVYVEKNTMEVVLGMGKGVVIEEVIEDDEVKEASETRKCDHPPWSSESMNEKRNKRLSEEFQFRKMLFDIDLTFGLDFSHKTLEMKNEVKAEQEMEEPVHNDFHPLMNEDELVSERINQLITNRSITMEKNEA
ncbi:hypothetical protein Tco_0546686 [Tanacetum coccineum]